MADSKPSVFPTPDDTSQPRAQRPDADEDAIDLGRYSSSGEGSSSSLSFSGRSAARGGSSVITWDELVRFPTPGDELLAAGSSSGADIDAASATDVLRELWGNEPANETPAPPAAAPPAQADGPAEVADSSKIDLVADLAPSLPSDPQGQTDQVGAPPMIQLSGAGEQPFLGEPPPGDSESSAVDLGSQPVVNLPFPLGVDSSVGPERDGTPRAPSHRSDSDIVDLLTSSKEFGFPLRAPGQSTADELRAREEPPATLPLPRLGPNRVTAWVGGGLVGLLAGIAASVAVMMSGVVSPRPVSPAGPIERDDTRAEARASAELAQKARADLEALTAQLKQAHLDLHDLPAVNQQLPRAEAEAAQGRQAQADLDRRLRQAEDETRQAQSKLNALTSQLQQAHTATDGAVKAAEAQIVRLREQLSRATAEGHASEDRLKDQLTQTTTAHQALASFVQEVARRLQAKQFAAANAAPADLLAGLDRALARPPAGATEANLATAEQSLSKGWHAYRGRDYVAAEQWFAAAERANERDARYPYFLGLARLAQGRTEAAAADFRRGAALERQNLPKPAEVDRALEAVPHDARQAVNGFRPYR